MSNNTLYIIVGISIIAVTLIILLAYLKHRGVNVSDGLKRIKSFFTIAEKYTKAAESLTVGKTKEILQSADAFEKLAIEATGYAEQMLLSLQIQNDTDGSQRRELAQNYIYAFLQVHGIAITDDIKTIVTGIVEKSVLNDKTIEEINIKIDKAIGEKVTVLQKQIESLTTTNNTLTQENQTLKQRLANIATQMATK